MAEGQAEVVGTSDFELFLAEAVEKVLYRRITRNFLPIGWLHVSSTRRDRQKHLGELDSKPRVRERTNKVEIGSDRRGSLIVTAAAIEFAAASTGYAMHDGN